MTVAAPETSELVLDDIRLMVEHALTTGRPVPGTWLRIAASEAPYDAQSIRHLGRCHDALAALVAPATPRTLRYLRDTGSLHGGIPLLRRLALLAIGLLVLFVTLATRPEVGGGAADFESGAGMELLLNLLFQVSAAGLGATLAALSRANRHIGDFTFDPRFEFSYWVLIMLGLLSGLVLAQLVPLDGDGRAFGRPLLALIGGFSVEAVYQVLQRLVDIVLSLVGSDGEHPADTARAERDRAHLRDTQLKVGVAGQLMAVRSTVTDDAAGAAIDALIAELAPGEAQDPVTA